jgi:ferredoxin
VSVCPVDCIYRYTGDDHETFPNQLYIHPDECIDCGACEPACPWETIFEEAAVPGVFTEDTALNYKIMEHSDLFAVCEHEDKPKPSPDEVEANKRKWEYVP